MRYSGQWDKALHHQMTVEGRDYVVERLATIAAAGDPVGAPA
jgi:hypothetical protein